MRLKAMRSVTVPFVSVNVLRVTLCVTSAEGCHIANAL